MMTLESLMQFVAYVRFRDRKARRNWTCGLTLSTFITNHVIAIFHGLWAHHFTFGDIPGNRVEPWAWSLSCNSYSNRVILCRVCYWTWRYHQYLSERNNFLIFIAIAIWGYVRSLIYVALGLILHGLFDILYGPHATNPSPEWWAPFCLGVDIVMGFYLLYLVKRHPSNITVRPSR